MGIDGATRLAGVMGWPVSHSLSPRLHNHWFARHAVNGVYVPLPVRPEDIGQAIRALPTLGFAGANVTIPHKGAAFELVDEHDDAAMRMRAVNTILVLPDGRLRGLNTDGYGFMANLRAAAPAWRASGTTAVLIGTGGAARAIAHALVASGIEALRLVNRTRERAAMLANELGATCNIPIEVRSWEDRHDALAGAGLLVNCTSLGMVGQPPLDLDLAGLQSAAVVADIVYVPRETDLLRAAKAGGLQAVDGLGMLLHQAVPGFAHWGGVEPSVDAETRALMAS